MEVDIKPAGDGWALVRLKGCSSKYEAYAFASGMRKKGLLTTRPRYRKGLWLFKVRKRKG